MKRVDAILLFFLFSLSCQNLSLSNEKVVIATASNFLETLVTLKKDFESNHDIEIEIRSASSGILYAQILRGIKVDIFLSADEERADMIIEKKLARASDSFIYAVGKLALWFPGSVCQLSTMSKETAQECLIQSKRIGIANEKIAPYGRAAKETLDSLSLPRTDQKLIRAENIGQTFALGVSQNVDAAFVAMSQLKKLKGSPSYWLVESSSHAAINQKAVLLSQKKAHEGAKQFFDYLKSEDAQRRISAAGYHYQKAYLP